jgi:phage baseplate assembly protein W
MNGKEFLCPQKCENKKFSVPGYCPVCEKGLVETITTCTLKDSIAQRIHLILITNLNEFRYDVEFGNKMWDNDFENIPNINQWKDIMAKSIKEAIIKFEKRLLNVNARLELTEEEFINREQQSLKKIKKRVDVKIQGNLKKTNEQFYFQELMYISPLWID